MAKPKDLSIENVQKLAGMKLPETWKCVRAEIKFERPGILGEWATVVYDGQSETFYVQTNKAIVYPNDLPALEEAVAIMRRANEIIQSPRKETDPQ